MGMTQNQSQKLQWETSNKKGRSGFLVYECKYFSAAKCCFLSKISGNEIQQSSAKHRFPGLIMPDNLTSNQTTNFTATGTATEFNNTSCCSFTDANVGLYLRQYLRCADNYVSLHKIAQ